MSRASERGNHALFPEPAEMRAIHVREFGGPEVLKLEEVERPEPRPGQTLVKLEAIGVNPVDTYIRSGHYTRLPDLPYTPGRDGAGTTPDGRRVYLSGSLTGTYAEYALCREEQIFPLPDCCSFEQGAALGVPYVTAYQALFHRGQARPGQRLLVHGASGAVGQAAVQLARAAGLRVTGSAGSERGLELARAAGAHQALAHRDTQASAPYDLILEMLASVNLDRDLDMLDFHGRVVVIGNRGPTQIDARKTMTRDLSIVGLSVVNATAEELKSIHAALAAGLENGTLNPAIRSALPLEQAPEAHRLVMEPGSEGKILLKP